MRVPLNAAGCQRRDVLRCRHEFVFDPQQRWPERVMLVFGFVGIAVVALAAGWLVGTALKSWQWLGG
jgi:hypothetical protein